MPVVAMGAWITLFGALAGYGLWHWLRIKEERTLHDWGHARQETSPPKRLDVTPAPRHPIDDEDEDDQDQQTRSAVIRETTKTIRPCQLPNGAADNYREPAKHHAD
jgi:hypothetical protein